ncbi:pth11-like integral membrane protein [Apodospora peruviana]|uniref:Pth11-like integral membrane protein n=1 Tax=Apodospora peruviana TaxID=516989 RepID=A0AAE0LZU0_9PEZI|nr:pth11-like integral membrane protein [Apodospora peruviana]
MTMDPTILAVFGPPPEGTDLTENRAHENDAAAVAMLVLSAIFMILRFMARVVQRSGLHMDDWVTIVALFFVGATVGLTVAGSAHGAGKHVWAVTLGELTLIFQIMYAYTFVYAAAATATKVSILFFYRRIFVTTDLSFRISIYLGFFLSLSYPIIVWITMANCCKPLSFYWNQFSGAQGECIDSKSFFLALGIVNMLNDIFILMIPIPQIFKLQMSNKKKVAVTGILLLGSFVCIASVLRIYYLAVFINALDTTWVMGPVFIWTAIEPSLGIVSACLPHLGPLRHIVKEKLSGALSSGHTDQGSKGTPWRFSVRGDKKMLKLVDADDEIGLTNRVTAGSVLGKAHSSGSGGSEENVNAGIVVQSSFTQQTETKNGTP